MKISQEPSSSAGWLKTAVVIPVLNERLGLVELIETLRRQISPGDEIIFADAGSTDGGAEIIREAVAKDPRVRLISSPGAFPGGGRNAAVRNTDAAIIAQVDGRNMPNDIWLDEIRRPIIRGEADYVTGNTLIFPQMKKFFGVELDLNALYGAGLFREHPLRGPCLDEAKNLKSHEPAGGDSVAYKREVWEKAGGFPDWLRAGEDPIFVRKVKQQQPRFAFAEKAVVFWQIGPRFSNIWRRHVNNQKVFFRTPEALRARVPNILLNLLIPLAAIISMPFPRLWPVSAALPAALSLRQGLKTLRVFKLRANPDPSRLAVAVALLFLLEPAFVLARVWGTFVGFNQLVRQGFTPFKQRVEKYLSS
ncbi:MAG: glycosyltransferase [Pseudomonadota bacterium]